MMTADITAKRRHEDAWEPRISIGYRLGEKNMG